MQSYFFLIFRDIYTLLPSISPFNLLSFPYRNLLVDYFHEHCSKTRFKHFLLYSSSKNLFLLLIFLDLKIKLYFELIIIQY